MFRAARDGKLQGIRLKWKSKGVYDIYETCHWRTAILLEDTPTTEENMAAYGKLLKLMLETNKEMEKNA